MAFFSGDSRSTPLVDSEMSEAMRRRLHELIGIGWGALAILLALCLASYDVDDPSRFSATGEPPSNWLGRPGAIIADPMMRAFGLASWAIVIFLGVWAVRFLMHLGEFRLTGRVIAFPVAFFAAMIFASAHAPGASWQLSSGLGGFIGDTIVVSLIGLLPMEPNGVLVFISVVFGLAMAVAGAVSLGMTAPEAKAIARWMLRSLTRAALTIFGLIMSQSAAAIAKVKEHRTQPRSERMEPAVPTGSWRDRFAEVRARRARTKSGGAAPRADGIDFEKDTGPVDDGPLGVQQAIRSLTGLSAGSDEEASTPASPGGPKLAASGGVAVGEEPAAPVATPAAKRQKMSRRAAREREPMLFESMNEAEEYQAPPLALLEQKIAIMRQQASGNALHENARMLETVLEDYGVRGEITAVKPGPVVTLYELEPAPGLKASRIIGLADDIARSMSALSTRVSTVPGRSVIGIELPNPERERVLLRELIESPAYGDNQIKLALALGKDISGQPIVANLAKMPHLLIAGTTGSGKSVAINTMILSLLYRLSPKQCRLIMIDPKMLELSVYDNIPHLLAPVVTDPKKALVALKWVVAEMEERYRKMSKLGVRNIDGYNARVREALEKGEDFSRVVQTGFDDTTGEPVYESEALTPEELPYIVVIVDEMADLMMVAGKEIEACIQRLAQMARASGIHLIMATQRPSVDVITGTIKANFPTRISFQVTSKIDSRTILGEQGAEQLLGQGDMLYMAGGGRITRVHGPFVSDQEVEEVVNHLKDLGQPDYVGAVTDGGDEETQALVDEKLGLAGASDDEATLYDKAVAIVARDRKCSTSYIQRKLAIGYNKAARLVEQMESQGVVSSANAVGKREIMIEER
ncbi:MAG: DNA translocase FtsK [Paracoccaceae bacterium]|nr:DNA translocase FtsK [Paracoccaceae bacterium]